MYAIPWYALSQKDKKLFFIFLQQTQQPIGMKLYGSVCLNAESGLNVSARRDIVETRYKSILHHFFSDSKNYLPILYGY